MLRSEKLSQHGPEILPEDISGRSISRRLGRRAPLEVDLGCVMDRLGAAPIEVQNTIFLGSNGLLAECDGRAANRAQRGHERSRFASGKFYAVQTYYRRFG